MGKGGKEILRERDHHKQDSILLIGFNSLWDMGRNLHAETSGKKGNKRKRTKKKSMQQQQRQTKKKEKEKERKKERKLVESIQY